MNEPKEGIRGRIRLAGSGRSRREAVRADRAKPTQPGAGDLDSGGVQLFRFFFRVSLLLLAISVVLATCATVLQG
jgi:hypothetical protein